MGLKSQSSKKEIFFPSGFLTAAFVLVCLFTLSTKANAEAKPPKEWQTYQLSRHIGFLSLQKCNQSYYSSPLCALMPVKYSNWTTEEKRIVLEAVKPIQDGRLNFLFKFLKNQKAKKIEFVRVNEENKTFAFTLKKDDEMLIYLGTSFFKSGVHFGKFSIQSHTILHEMMHIYSLFSVGSDYAQEPFWLELESALEWKPQSYLCPLIDKEKRDQSAAQYWSLSQKHKWEEANLVDYNFSRPLGFPSMYSMIAIQEYYAELTSTLFHDPQLAESLPQPVIRWLEKNGFASLLPASLHPVVLDKQKDRFLLKDGTWDFVGLSFVDAQPLCTVMAIKHGLMISSRHCFKNFASAAWTSSQGMNPQSSLQFEFRMNDGKTLIIYGAGDISSIRLDSGENDFAYISYNPQLTLGKLNIPEIKIAVSPPVSGQELINIAYPRPVKPQTLRRWTSLCRTTSEYKSLSAILPEYLGPLVGTTCPAWFGSSGSPLLSEVVLNGQNVLTFWGVLAHTFEVDQHGEILSEKILRDEWGSYTNSNFSGVFLAKDLQSMMTTLH